MSIKEKMHYSRSEDHIFGLDNCQSKTINKNPKIANNSYLCNQLGNALFCVTSGIFAGRAQRDPAKLHELHKIAFPKVLHTRFFLILTKKSFFKR
jgi:hypothetical protein